MNLAAMFEAFERGARSVSDEIDVERVRLYDLDFKGCRSCMACKLKGKPIEVCAIKDGATEALSKTAHADGICFGSPIYYMDVTGEMRSFLERLLFPWGNYKTGVYDAPKRVPTAFIYTMNADDQYQQMMEPLYSTIDMILGMSLTKPERIKMECTMQVKDYSRYEFSDEWVEHHKQWHAEHYVQDLQKAYDAGRRMAEKIMQE